MVTKFLPLTLLVLHHVTLGETVVCYKCRSVEGNNQNCRDPFTSQMKPERRDCPAYERCAKITGSNNNRQSVIIRDCYKTNFQPKSGGYRDRKIQYYNEAIDGVLDVCKTNLCNTGSTIAVHIMLLVTLLALKLIHTDI